ncbi:polysaccharide biosynthesis protein [Sandarakinorhabdus sp. DWP1-3-1]|uniref:polysaccharide biosynthesis protein n=1 Tax=Sandarakinorhabdus sp. DWP1-3-1 TaxID=2804627 RepID=UPI003CFA1B4A
MHQGDRQVLGKTIGNRRDRFARSAGKIALDASAAGAALAAALWLRMSGDIPPAMHQGLVMALPTTVLVTGLMLYVSGVYNRAWRFVSLVDLVSVVPAATLSVVATVLAIRLTTPGDWLPLSVPIIQWFILVVAICAMRLVRRLVCDRHTLARATDGAPAAPRQPRPVLLVGTIERVEIALRSLETSERGRYRAVGIIDQDGRNLRMRMRGVPVLGALDAVEQVVNGLDAVGQRPEYVFLVDGPEAINGPDMVRLVSKAEFLGLKVGRIAQAIGVESHADQLDLRFIDIDALLDRPQVQRDQVLTRRAIAGRRVLVTGAGGTIGSELVRQIAALDPAELILLDHSEINLYTIDLEMTENFGAIKRSPVLCSIRQRECLMNVFETYRPELVFHAAALKHVPLVEINPCAGVLTNVLGTRNVADAVRRHGVSAMVQVSTDKAVNPVGVMGATKRLGELYCQALDLAGEGKPGSPRFVTVRFGNVLGSSGSLIPLFQRQLSRRGPLTVTHADIERFFMTVHEAVNLILQATAEAMNPDVRRGRIFVLDMGDPVKIIDIARRMIRLAGLQPDIDVKIKVVGLRPGEKLYEELFDSGEKRMASSVPGIMEAEPVPVPHRELQRLFDRLETEALADHADTVRRIVLAATGQPVTEAAIVVAPEPAAPARQPVRVPRVPAGAGVPANAVAAQGAA